jgi:hypothetical protein
MPTPPIFPDDDITGLQDIDANALPRTDPPTKRTTSRAKFLGIILPVIGLVAAAVAWAASEHDTIKDWTVEKDYATKKEVMDIVEKHYVTSEDFVEVKTEQKHIKEKVDKIDKKTDEMHDLLIRGQRPHRDRHRRTPSP